MTRVTVRRFRPDAPHFDKIVALSGERVLDVIDGVVEVCTVLSLDGFN